MSTAEYTAQKVFNTYHLDKMPEDVKMHLIVLLAQTSVSKDNYIKSAETEDASYIAREEVPPMLSMEEINSRMDAVEADIKAGRTYPIDEFFEEMEGKYSWLCK